MNLSGRGEQPISRRPGGRALTSPAPGGRDRLRSRRRRGSRAWGRSFRRLHRELGVLGRASAVPASPRRDLGRRSRRRLASDQDPSPWVLLRPPEWRVHQGYPSVDLPTRRTSARLSTRTETTWRSPRARQNVKRVMNVWDIPATRVNCPPTHRWLASTAMTIAKSRSSHGGEESRVRRSSETRLRTWCIGPVRELVVRLLRPRLGRLPQIAYDTKGRGSATSRISDEATNPDTGESRPSEELRALLSLSRNATRSRCRFRSDERLMIELYSSPSS